MGTYLRYPAAAELIGVSIPLMQQYVYQGHVPFIRLSPRVVVFQKEELEAWLEERRAESRAHYRAWTARKKSEDESK